MLEKIIGQLDAMHDEISILAKKKPDDAINEFKLNYINQILNEANPLLEDNYRPFADFDSFDTNTLPTNSDVVLILSQYLKCTQMQYYAL